MSELIERLGAALPSRYRLVRQIGRGGAAHVFLAHESQPERDVAIKVLDPSLAVLVGPDRFIREVDFTSKLSHPHILPIFAAGESQGFLYYVMPYIPGETLRDRLDKERTLPIRQALEIAREVADALSYAHARDIVHRDIKPENILLQASHAIVADFGIARAIAGTEAQPAITYSGFIVGTPAYMSPEQATAEATVDGRTDIYSLGCVLYEMLTGTPPHHGSTEVVLVDKFRSPPVPVTILRPEVPQTVESAVARALAREPSDRFATAAEFRDALGAALTPDAAPATVSPPSAPTRRARTPPATRTPPRILTSRIGLTLLLLTVGAVNWLETTLDTWMGTHVGWIRDMGHQMASAMQWLEGGLSFAGHDIAGTATVYGYTAAYFFLFPLIAVAVALALAHRQSIRAFRSLVVALVADYALTLPFFLFVPVPERWSVPGSGAVLLSDRWSSSLIEAFRPISGLDNCFPSFHVSWMVITVLAAFAYELPFRRTVLVGSIVVVFSTVALGVHWLADVVGGVGVALASWWVAVRLERRWTEGRRHRPVRSLRPALLGLALLFARPGFGSAQEPIRFLGVAVDADSRRADDALRHYLEENAGVRFVAEPAYEYSNVIDELVSWKPEDGPLMARVTPYALVAAELLGADVHVMATYVSRATGGTTYYSYLVMNRSRFPYASDLAFVPRWIRGYGSPPVFAFHSEFSTSSFFLPALYFRSHDIFDMPASSEQASAIRSRLVGGTAMDVVKGVARQQYDFAAVWSGTKATLERTDSLARRYGPQLAFIQLPTPLPNDLLVVSASMDSTTTANIRRAIRTMGPREVDVGDFLTWQALTDAQGARSALADLRWLAREPLAQATVDVQPVSTNGQAVPAEQIIAVRQAVRLAGNELVNFDRDFHAVQDYIWTVEPIHDGALMLRSRVTGSDADDQEFQLSFRTTDELTDRIVDLIHTRLNRIRYVWPYRTSPPTVLRDFAFRVRPATTLAVRKIHWLDTHRHSYLQDATFTATVAAADFYKIELQPDFIPPPDPDGYGFNPMSSVSYRVVLVRTRDQPPLFRFFAVSLVVLAVLGGAAAAWDLRRLTAQSSPADP